MILVIKFLMLITSLFLIVLVLLQRGRGGGLAGALGGMGGQSAFGSKAGDVFTRVTSGVAIVWILLCVGALKYFGGTTDLFDPNAGGAAPPAQESVERQPSGQKASPSDASGSPAGASKSGASKSGASKPGATKTGGSKSSPAAKKNNAPSE